MEWQCATCGKIHDDLPLSWAADFPDRYANMTAEQRDNRSVISSDQCIIDSAEFYIRGCLEIPIQDTEDIFLWGVWASLFEKDFDEISDSWEEVERETKHGPYKGRLANALHQSTHDALNLKLMVRLRPVGEHPLFYIDEPEHPLALAQTYGMMRDQALKLAENLLHAVG